MRRGLIIALATVAFLSLLFAQSGRTVAPDREAEKKIIHLKADLSGPIAKGDSVIFLVGNVAAQHNGAVITCDSAVRYSDTHVECFGNVLINKNSTYMYGDRADYDGANNLVTVYSELVKVIDGEATLYASSFQFNTKENVGRFSGGGVLLNRDNVMEAQEGYYYTDLKELVAVRDVQMRNNEYEMTGDSVCYNTATDYAQFFRKTHIWDADGNFLYGDRGNYSKADQRYMVTENSYLLTKEQELWSDTLDYYRTSEHVILHHNLQIDETTHKTLSFGDYGEYWQVEGNGFLTKNPVIVNYDAEQNPDSVFMRSDSIYLYTLKLGDPIPNEYALKAKADSLARAAQLAAEAEATGEGVVPASPTINRSSMAGNPLGLNPREAVAQKMGEKPAAEKETTSDEGDEDNENEDESAEEVVASTDSLVADTLAADSLDTMVKDTLTAKERLALEKAQRKEEARRAAELKRKEKAAAKKALLDSIAIVRQAKATAKLRKQEEKDSLRRVAQRAKAKAKLAARIARDRKRGISYKPDSMMLLRMDSLWQAEWPRVDSVMQRWSDSLDSVAAVKVPVDSTLVDSTYRFVKGFRNVKIYRPDFQVVCDSLTANTSDSTLHLFLEPVLWNQQNQITATVMDVYTANQKLDRAEFVGDPMMCSQFDTTYYDQIKGKTMEALFHDNEIYRLNVDGNVQTIFCHKDGYPQQVVMVAFIESGDASFYIVERQVEKIIYRVNPEWPIFPVDKIPEDRSLYLEGFKWQGDRRPTRAEVFDRVVRPSMREERESAPHPDFPIRQWIDRQREELVREGRWADRNDRLDQQTIEWMQSLGFEVETGDAPLVTE